ncbi:hypothetical protein, partial [Pararhizobium sp. PWRC1-1]|uniref:hypothetical protein n=1 Tax=Pararhizobium sp. PWRC1-1 TaxID=2804566 RepID=UPI003CEE0500
MSTARKTPRVIRLKSPFTAPTRRGWQLCFYVCEKIVLSLVIAFAMASILRARAMMMTLKGLPR